jgi:hypothetical protein
MTSSQQRRRRTGNLSLTATSILRIVSLAIVINASQVLSVKKASRNFNSRQAAAFAARFCRRAGDSDPLHLPAVESNHHVDLVKD